MNCRRVRKLIPLYVEDDVEASVASRVAAHIEWCGQCNWLADEYRESQGWLRASAPPEFDANQLSTIKRSVLAEIAAIRQRPSVLALLAQWNRRHVLALSTAVLLIFGMVLLYLYQTRVTSTPSPAVAKETQQDEDSAPETTSPRPAPKPTPGAYSKPHHRQSRDLHRLVARPPRTTAPDKNEPQVAEVATQSDQTVVRSDTSASSKEMLRIEIQTSDPLIRIIWFAPKETDQRQSKPATD